MATPIMAHLQRLLLVCSVPRFDELEELARRIEHDACRLAGMAKPAGQGDVLTRLRRAGEALEACVPAPAAGEMVTAAAAVARETGHRAADGGPGGRAAAEPPRAALGLIALRDEALLASHSEHTTARQVSERVIEQIGEILQAEGITALAASQTVDPQRHHVIGIRETQNPALDGKIAETVRPGYAFNGQVIRPEQVITWRAARAPASTDS